MAQVLKPTPVAQVDANGRTQAYALCPFHLHDFDDVILASKMEVLCE
jgi:hypothetical protein